MKKSINILLMLCLATGSMTAQTGNENYVKVIKARTRLFGDLSLISDKSLVAEVITYYDGLGREWQTVDRALSPLGKDVVKFDAYDGYGKNSISYLPYVSSETSGFLKSEPLSEQLAFYNGLFNAEESRYAFSQQVFEHSELARSLIQSSPGAAWKLAGHKTIRNEHTANADSEICLYRYNNSNGSIQYSGDFYPSGKLTRVTTIDEDGHESCEYYNEDELVVCKKIKLSATISASTYYVYDDFGNLVVAIQPEGVKGFLDRTVPVNPSQP